MILLSYIQARQLLNLANKQHTQQPISLDLGLSEAIVTIQAEHISLPDKQSLDWHTISDIAKNETACFLIENGQASKIQFFSEEFNRFYSLMPTSGAPTMLISGIPMHRIKDTDPHRDTQQKIAVIRPIRGRVLDTATGLGYTAIAAAQMADEVVTIELDPVVLEICRLNPWSRGLFDNPSIKQHIGDSFEVISGMQDKEFNVIIHDPPTFSLAGHLYSSDYYEQLFRVLKSGGKLFHYIGDPKSKSGSSVTRGVVRRLKETQFVAVRPAKNAFGVVASKK